MRKSMKKLLFGILACAFMIAAFAWVKPQTVQAAPALTKADFTKAYGKPKINFVKWCKDNGYGGSNAWAWYAIFPTKKVGEETIKNFATNRKIKIEKSTKKDVFKKYGTATELKVILKYDCVYKASQSAAAAGTSAAKRCRKAIKQSKTYVDYSYYDKKAGCEYTLRFYFTKQDKVNVVVYFKNFVCMDMYFFDM